MNGSRVLIVTALLATGAGLLGVPRVLLREPAAILRIGTDVWPGYEPLYLAGDLGLYASLPVRMVECPSASAVIRAYRNDALEVAALTMDEVLLLMERGERPHIVLVLDVSQGGDAIIGSAQVRDLHELRGRRVGVESTAAGALVLARALEIAGISRSEIQVVPLEAGEHEQAVLDGRVDAVVTTEPVRSNLMAHGGRVLFDSQQLPGEVVNVLVVREETLAQQRPALRILVEGWFRALDYLRLHGTHAAAKMASREGVSVEQFLRSLEGLRIPDLAENRRLLGEGEGSIRTLMRRLSSVMVARKLLTQPVDAAKLIDPSLLPQRPTPKQ